MTIVYLNEWTYLLLLAVDEDGGTAPHHNLRRSLHQRRRKSLTKFEFRKSLKYKQQSLNAVVCNGDGILTCVATFLLESM